MDSEVALGTAMGDSAGAASRENAGRAETARAAPAVRKNTRRPSGMERLFMRRRYRIDPCGTTLESWIQIRRALRQGRYFAIGSSSGSCDCPLNPGSRRGPASGQPLDCVAHAREAPGWHSACEERATMNSIFHSSNSLQHWPVNSSVHDGDGFPSSPDMPGVESDQKDRTSLIARNPVAALFLTVGVSLLAGTAWTTVMVWWTLR